MLRYRNLEHTFETRFVFKMGRGLPRAKEPNIFAQHDTGKKTNAVTRSLTL